VTWPKGEIVALFKWFEKIQIAQEAEQRLEPGPLKPFEFASLRPVSWAEKAKAKFSTLLLKFVIKPLLWIFYWIYPNPYFSFFNFAIVTRDEDVRQILWYNDVFGVPYGPEMKQLADGVDFALGLDGERHQRQNQIMRDVMFGSDVPHWKTDMTMVLDLTKRMAASLIENCNGRIDIFTDYFTRVAAETGARYLGVEASNPVAFAEWSLAVSGLLFGDPLGDAKTRALALNGGRRLCILFDDAIRRTQQNFREHPNTTGRDKCVIDRLVQLQIDRELTSDPISDGEIKSILVGLVTGFIPTNTLASSKIFEELLSRPPVLAQAVDCAVARDRVGLLTILKEAARLNSPMAPGQWRIAKSDAVIAPGTSRSRSIPKGTVILASTMTALRDHRRFTAPNRFQTDREVWGDLIFGGGPHACLGTQMALEQLTELFMILLALPGLKVAGGKKAQIEFVGTFPVRLDMEFDSHSSTQSMFLLVIPVWSNISKYGLDKELAKFGHGAAISESAKIAFEATKIVHFASMSTVTSNRGLDIIVELCVDGSVDNALQVLADKAGDIFGPFLRYSDLRPEEELAVCMKRHLVMLHSKPWGATGLDYYGTGEFSISAIEKQQAFARLTEDILADYLDEEVGKGNQPMRALTYVRRILNQDRFHALRTNSPRAELMRRAKAANFDAYRLKPSRAILKLADYKTPTYWGAFRDFLAASESQILLLPIIALALCFGYSLLLVVDPPAVLSCPAYHPSQALSKMWQACRFEPAHLVPTVLGWAGVVVGAALATLLTVGAFASAALLYLRYKEKRDIPDPSQAPVEHVVELGRHEDYPGYAHNHFMALGDFKPGLFRTLVHAFALWGIKMIIIFYYRPGFVINMGTIHYARWWRLPGTKRSIFFSNYDGSWDSYLEDFITRARWGQTAAWSNWQGFPKTKDLIFKGAEDGDRFKRWVRTKQQVVPFWYSRFPELTTDQIRNNALIHHGIARIQTDSEAREWLRCFGSMPRVANLIEADEVQSIVFKGMRTLKYSTCLLLKLPVLEHYGLAYWLKAINGGEGIPLPKADAHRRAIIQASGIEASGFVSNDKVFRLSKSLCIAFGERQAIGEEKPDSIVPALHGIESLPIELSAVGEGGLGGLASETMNHRAAVLALSAAGFRKFHGVSGGLADLPESFPTAFKIGMTGRSRILGDQGNASPVQWRWGDGDAWSPAGSTVPVAEAAVMLYAQNAVDLDIAVQAHKILLAAYGGKIVAQTDCAPAFPAGSQADGREHFGYRDGISQPVIRGTERFAKGVPDRDIVEPGEIILGYESNQGFLPPSPLVRAEDDYGGDLPVPSDRELSRFPDFGAEQLGAMPRDFGRNGTFMVIRELEQNVSDFEAIVAEKAREISTPALNSDQRSFPHLYTLTGQAPNTNWVKAKLMGRWPDGRPLVGNPIEQTDTVRTDLDGSAPRAVLDLSRYRAERENDFSYGIDDPQGFACPFGAHIRRTNPRDSKQPGDVSEQTITNRHRLLRRGRSYTRTDGNGKEEKGLLFVALCADLERQFEFVQQTWANSPSFHGLSDEPDPIIGSGKSIADTPACFTIPTPAGSIKLTGLQNFVTTRAGGYFFLPSRSALTFLKERAFR
jgi:Dyp-type peroxidase family